MTKKKFVKISQYVKHLTGQTTKKNMNNYLSLF